MVPLFFDILKTARPRQWIKNLTLYAALIFTGNLYSRELLLKNFGVVTGAIGAFTLVAIAIYFFNDLVDIKADRIHPFKKKRPIADGRITKDIAWLIIGASSLVGILWAAMLSPLFLLVVLGYLGMQILYSLWLKNVEVADIYVIALGFFLRVLAGAIVINAHVSIWFTLCVMSTSLFLAVGKRRAELSITNEVNLGLSRKVMSKYSASILDTYLAMFATAAFLSWSLYTFNFYEQEYLTPQPLVQFAFLSRTLTINKWLMATIPVVIFGIMRYIAIVYNGAKAETPERVILSDTPLLGSVIVWAGIVLAVLYLLPL